MYRHAPRSRLVPYTTLFRSPGLRSSAWWDQRPRRRAKNPPRDSSFAWPGQRTRWGTFFMTWSTCWPQPAQVVLPQIRQVVARHMMVSLRAGEDQAVGVGAFSKRAAREGSEVTRFQGILERTEAMAQESLRAE